MGAHRRVQPWVRLVQGGFEVNKRKREKDGLWQALRIAKMIGTHFYLAVSGLLLSQ